MCNPFYCKFSSKLLEPPEKCIIIYFLSCVASHLIKYIFFNSKENPSRYIGYAYDYARSFFGEDF